MRRLEVFFDYICPYCLKAHQYLTELLPEFDDIQVVWRPCESHPRPDNYAAHSDLCIEGMFYAQEKGADINKYHKRMYAAALTEKTDIEDPVKLAGRVADFLNPDEFLHVLRSGIYEQAAQDANAYAFEKSGVWVVPAYRLEGRKLDAVENIGVTKEQLRAFLK